MGRIQPDPNEVRRLYHALLTKALNPDFHSLARDAGWTVHEAAEALAGLAPVSPHEFNQIMGGLSTCFRYKTPPKITERDPEEAKKDGRLLDVEIQDHLAPPPEEAELDSEIDAMKAEFGSRYEAYNRALRMLDRAVRMGDLPIQQPDGLIRPCHAVDWAPDKGITLPNPLREAVVTTNTGAITKRQAQTVSLKGNKHPVASGRLSEITKGCRWSDVSVVLTTEHTVKISTQHGSTTYSFDQIGLSDNRSRKTPKPNVLWKTLVDLAEGEGFLCTNFRQSVRSYRAEAPAKKVESITRALPDEESKRRHFENERKRDLQQKHVSDLNRALAEIFSIKTHPLAWVEDSQDGPGWKAEFNISDVR